MSVLFVLIYIIKDAALRRCTSKRQIEDDDDFLRLFSRILVGLQVAACMCSYQLVFNTIANPIRGEVSTALEEGIRLEWTEVYDYVNPFGDRRGAIFNSIWTFDLDKDLLLLTKPDRVSSVPLKLARQRPVTLSDFHLVDQGTPADEMTESLASPYWGIEMNVSPQLRSFIGRILTDFGHTWRHILRRPMNRTTFTKLAHATVWISMLQFDIFERQEFEMVSGQGGPYVWVLDLPSWDTPEASFFQVGSTWFIISQQLQDGINMAQDQARSYPLTAESRTCTNVYVILTLRQITLCKIADGDLVWTRPEPLFSGSPPSTAAIDMLIWASNPPKQNQVACRLNLLPLEIQNSILRHATSSPVSSARLGCILSLGSPFPWAERGRKIQIQERKRNRTADSPVESQIVFRGGVMSGLSYRLEPLPTKTRTTDLPESVQAQMGLMSTRKEIA